MAFTALKPRGFQATRVPELALKLARKSAQEQRELFQDILNRGVHGLCFSLYEEGQQPGDPVTEEQIRRRLGILKPHTRWIRSFSCTEGNELIPLIAREMGFKTLVGAWLGEDTDKNRQELDGLVALARRGLVDVAAVGNEVLYRDDLSEQALLEHIMAVKAQLPDLPVGYVDAYYEFVERPSLAQACDVILCNCYPYWEGTPFEQALAHMQHMHQLATAAAQGKPVVITETGWPSQGEGKDAAIPSQANAMAYFILTQLWAQAEQIPTFYFSSFDEAWKVDAEGDVGAYWGIWDSRGQLKY